MDNKSLELIRANKSLEDTLRLAQKLESKWGIDTKLLREPIEEARRLGLNEISINELCATISGYLYCIFHPSRSHPEWNINVEETSPQDGLKLSTDVNKKIRFLTSLGEDNIDILNYLAPFVVVSSKRKTRVRRESNIEREIDKNQDLSIGMALEVDELFYGLDENKKAIVKAFIKYMFESNYKINGYEYASENRHISRIFRVHPLEVIISYLKDERTIPPENTRRELFEALADERIKFINGHTYERQSLESRINDLIEDHIRLLKEDYPNREKAVRCLNAAFCSFNLGLYHKYMSYMGSIVIFSRDSPSGNIDEIKKIMESVVSIIKEGADTNEFYDFLRLILSPGWIKDFFSYSSHLPNLRKNTNRRQLQILYDHTTREKIGLKDSLRGLEILLHGEVEDIDKLIELRSLQIPYYLPIAIIGEGKTRRVYKVIYQPRSQVLALKLDFPVTEITNPRTIKIIELHNQSEREITALMNLTHENLARMWDFGQILIQAPQ